jgi:maleate isomerase
VERSARGLAELGPEVILYACMSGTFLAGNARHAEMGARIRQETGIPGITTATAVLDALRELTAKRIFMITPYPNHINDQEAQFLAHHGIEVSGYDSFLHQDSLQNTRKSSADTAALVLKNRQDADAVLISCTNLKTMDRIERLESELGIPVISSNSATLWSGLRQVGVSTAKIRLGALYRMAPSQQRH